MHRTLLNDNVVDEPQDPEHSIYTPEHGLLPGNDGGYSDFHYELLAEDARTGTPCSTYKLLGETPAPPTASASPLLSSSIGLLASPQHRGKSTQQYLQTLQRQHHERHYELRNRALDADLSRQSQNQQQQLQNNQQSQPNAHQLQPLNNTHTKRLSIMQFLGSNNTVVRTVETIQKVLDLRNVVYDIMSPPSPPPPPPPPAPKQEAQLVGAPVAEEVYEICNDVKCKKRRLDGTSSLLGEGQSSNGSEDDAEESREDAMTKALCALLAMHSGFSHASARSLDIMCEVLRSFLWRLGNNLKGCVHDNKIPSAELMSIIGNSGFRGGFSHLVSYIKTDLPQSDMCIREVFSRIMFQIRAEDVLRKNTSLFQLIESFYLSTSNPSHPDFKPGALTLGEKSSKEEQTLKPGSGSGAHVKMEIDGDEEDGMKNGGDSTDVEKFISEYAFKFGYINKNTRLDILSNIKVPLKLIESSENLPANLK